MLDRVAAFWRESIRRIGALCRPAAISDSAYKIATKTRTNKAWEPANIGGDTATAQAVQLGNARIRDQVRNNPQFKRAKGALVDLIVGQGIRAFSTPFSFDFDVTALLEQGASGTDLSVPPDLVVELQYAWESDRWFSLWADDPAQCDVEGKLSWWDMQRLAFSEMIEVGDAIFLVVQRRSGNGRMIPFSLQLIEREQLDRTKDRPAATGQNKIVNGIELNTENKPVAYWIHDGHPDDTSYETSQRSTRVPAERIMHSFVPFRPSMNVGFSWFHAMASIARDRHWLIGSELTKAAIGALVTLVHYTDRAGQSSGPTLSDGEPDSDDQGNEIVKLGQAISMRAGIDEKVELFKTDTPSQTLRDFVDIIDHDQAAGAELSHLRYTGRWQQLSYTAGRGAQLDDEMHARPLKNFWGRALVLPVRKVVNAQMVAAGLLRSISATEFRRDEIRYQSFYCVGPGRDQLDPEKETESALTRMRSGLSTLQIENGNRGLHWLEVLLQMRRELLVCRLLGLKIDFSKGQGGQTTSTTTDAASVQRSAVPDDDTSQETTGKDAT